MAAAATKKNQQQAQPVATPVDPKFEWAEKTGSYVLRLPLLGFTKDDFRVQVDSAGRLIVRGTRTCSDGPGWLYRVFQLPSAASLDDIAGRFEAGVLTLTVPKRVGAGGPPTSIEEIKRKQPGAAKESKPKEEEIPKENALKRKAIDEVTNKAEQQNMEEEEAKTQQEKQPEEEASRPKQEQQKPASAPAKEEENVKPKAPQAAAATPPKKPKSANGGDQAKAAVGPESLVDRVRRRGEEEQGNAAPMAAAKRAKTDGEKKATAACVGWKERMQGELKVLTDMKWADSLVEAARNNKEVVTIGIAAFSLGLLVSHKLFQK